MRKGPLLSPTYKVGHKLSSIFIGFAHFFFRRLLVRKVLILPLYIQWLLSVVNYSSGLIELKSLKDLKDNSVSH